ncbi:MAG: hypothetical protein AAFU54_18890 [Chloroflexota bacterium]
MAVATKTRRKQKRRSRKKEVFTHTVMVEPFDLAMHTTRDGNGLYSLQNRFATWLRGISHPSRFIYWQMPADLRSRIDFVSDLARNETDPLKKRMLMENRRNYEQLQNGASYHRAFCGMGMWTDDSVTSGAIASNIAGSFDTPAWVSPWPKLFEGNYRLSEPHDKFRHWHLRPIGRPGGRMYFAFMSSYEFLPVDWNFYKPLSQVLSLPLPLALCIDIPKTWERNEAISSIEGTLLATKVHLTTSTSEDSKSAKKYNDCRQTLEELNAGDLLHDVQIIIAVAAPDRESLKKACDDVVSRTKGFFKLRHDAGEQQAKTALFFSDKSTKLIGNEPTTWQVTSREAALLLGPLGYRKLSGLAGTMRGQSADGAFPFFFNSWPQKKIATHEIVVGLTGSGKTFGLNCFLSRQYIEEGVAFDLLEPMGHGKIIAEAVGAPLFVPSPNETNMNPLDIMYPDPTEQITHVIRIVETMLGRQFSGTQQGNHQKALVGQALARLYGVNRGVDLFSIQAHETPIMEDLCDELSRIDAKAHVQRIAHDIADEIAGLCTGAGPYAKFVNAQTNLDLSFRGKKTPRVFSFNKMSNDPELLAIAYTQVLTAIRRDSLADEVPRTIAVDEVYRLMRHPSLLDFLVEAVKTFRTRRKKVIVIDQQMRVFLSSEKAKLLFENCPIRVIFNQRSGMDVFQEHVAFQHLTAQHLDTIASLRRGHFILDIQDLGVYYLFMRASQAEVSRFGDS